MQTKVLRTMAQRVPGLSRLTTAWHLAHTAVFLLRARVGHFATRLQQRQQKRDGSVWTTVAGRSLIAQPVSQFRSVDAATSSLNSLLATLDAAAVSHEIVVTPPELVQVDVSDLTAALQALGHSADAWYQHRDGRTRPLRHDTSSGSDDSVLVFQAWATHGGQFLAGADVGIELRQERTKARFTTVPEFPIDAVITWVDGSDPLWQARKRARRAEVTEELHETADNDARYESLDELKYCLRSIEMYAPWIRRIFLVTDRQVPAWLDPTDSWVTVVDHTQIFDGPADLPTFNSHAIEARLHHIPGLAEHWLYFNDDFFLTRSLAPSFFFTPDGQTKVFLAKDDIESDGPALRDTPIVAAAKNNRTWLRTHANYELRHKLKHVPYPQSRSLAIRLEKAFDGGFRDTAGSPFRSPQDISVTSSLLPHYSLATGAGARGHAQHFYGDVDSPELLWRLPRFVELRDADIVCLNATTSGTRLPERLEQFLAKIFPEPHKSYSG